MVLSQNGQMPSNFLRVYRLVMKMKYLQGMPARMMPCAWICRSATESLQVAGHPVALPPPPPAPLPPSDLIPSPSCFRMGRNAEEAKGEMARRPRRGSRGTREGKETRWRGESERADASKANDAQARAR